MALRFRRRFTQRACFDAAQCDFIGRLELQFIELFVRLQGEGAQFGTGRTFGIYRADCCAVVGLRFAM